MNMLFSNEQFIEFIKEGRGDGHIDNLTNNYMTQNEHILSLECTIQSILRHNSNESYPPIMYGLRVYFGNRLGFCTQEIDHNKSPNAKFFLKLIEIDDQLNEFLTKDNYWDHYTNAPDAKRLAKELRNLGASDDLQACFNAVETAGVNNLLQEDEL